MLVNSSQVTETNGGFQSKSSEYHSKQHLKNSSLCFPYYAFIIFSQSSNRLCFPVYSKYEAQNLYPSQLWLYLFKFIFFICKSSLDIKLFNGSF